MEIGRLKISMLLCLLFSGISLSAQEHFSELGFTVFQKNLAGIKSQAVKPEVHFAVGVYSGQFELSGTLNEGRGYYVNYANRFRYKKNAVDVDAMFGLNIYKYDFSLKQISPIDTVAQFDGSNASHQSIWTNNYGGSNGTFNYSHTIWHPGIRLGLNYYRTLTNFRGLQLEALGGFSFERRFNFLTQNWELPHQEGTPEEMVVNYNDVLNPKPSIVGFQIGFATRFNANNLKIGYQLQFSSGGTKSGFSAFQENALFVSYAKTLRYTKIAKEQLLISREDKQVASRLKRYRRGDKYSYIRFHGGESVSQHYELEGAVNNDVLIDGMDTLLRTTNGYQIKPRSNVSLSFNTFLGNRILGGIGIHAYANEVQTSGFVTNSSSGEVQTFDPSNEDAPYFGDEKTYQYFAPSIMMAFYFNGSQRVVEPFVRGRAIYHIPTFSSEGHAGIQLNRGDLDAFPGLKLGGGVDFRLRIRSSKYFVFALSGDYVINPIKNYTEVGLSIGYYRKKKLKNQRY